MLLSEDKIRPHVLSSNFFCKKFNSYYHLSYSDSVEELSKQFHNLLSDYFDLELNSNNSGLLHKFIPKKYSKYSNGATKITDIFYDKVSFFKKNYILILKELRKLIKKDFYFQKYPTFRIHMPHPTSHKYYPYFHSDILFGHPPYEINVFATLNKVTNKKDGHGLRILNLKKSLSLFSKYKFNLEQMNEDRFSNDKKLFSQSKLYSKNNKNLLIFDTRCYHSVMPLNNHTRISIDVRLMPKKIFEKYSTVYVGTGRKRVKFKPGYGYHSKSIDSI